MPPVVAPIVAVPSGLLPVELVDVTVRPVGPPVLLTVAEVVNIQPLASLTDTG